MLTHSLNPVLNYTKMSDFRHYFMFLFGQFAKSIYSLSGYKTHFLC